MTQRAPRHDRMDRVLPNAEQKRVMIDGKTRRQKLGPSPANGCESILSVPTLPPMPAPYHQAPESQTDLPPLSHPRFATHLTGAKAPSKPRFVLPQFPHRKNTPFFFPTNFFFSWVASASLTGGADNRAPSSCWFAAPAAIRPPGPPRARLHLHGGPRSFRARSEHADRGRTGFRGVRRDRRRPGFNFFPGRNRGSRRWRHGRRHRRRRRRRWWWR